MSVLTYDANCVVRIIVTHTQNEVNMRNLMFQLNGGDSFALQIFDVAGISMNELDGFVGREFSNVQCTLRVILENNKESASTMSMVFEGNRKVLLTAVRGTAAKLIKQMFREAPCLSV